jgi:hypothetical protein
MILIFDLYGGFTDMLRDLVSIYNFTSKYKYNFTIRNATCRPYNNPNIFEKYPIDNLINIESFKNNEYYIEYSKIEKNINKLNTYDFYKYKINGRLWKGNKFINKNDIIKSIINCTKEYINIGGSFWYYTNLYDMDQVSDIFKTLIPNDRILKAFNENIINAKYNCIHYRYESDWIPILKKHKIPYIVPPIDELINNLPFKTKHLIYICTSNIEELHEKKLLYNKLESYDNIIYKKKNNLNYDENGFLDLLILNNSEEFYGNSISGFTLLSSKLKKSDNFYNKIKYFDKYNIIS